jgi:hypothetical protein
VIETPKPLHEVTPSVPVDFSKAIQRAMAKDRGDRQATAGALERELEVALDGSGVASAAVPAADRAPASVENRLATVADRPTPTVGDSGAATIVESGVAAGKPAASQASTMPTVVVTAEELAAREAAKAREAPQAIPKPHVEIPLPSRRSPLVFVGAIVIALLLIVGAGGYALMRYMGSRSTAKPPANTDLSASMHEVARYWIQVDTTNPGETVRAGDTVAMKSGQSFKFHFSPNQSGYLYLLGPGPNNAPAIFLSAQPTARSGLKSNEVSSGVDFTFPADTNSKANFMTLDQNAGTDEFTFVFSPTAITVPNFFAGPSEHPLTSDELRQWNDFQAQAKVNPATLEVIKTGASPQTAVKVPQNGPENASVLFRVQIVHK